MEIWKPISEYEGYYDVSNLGRVRSITRLLYRTDPHDATKKRKFTYHGKIVPFWATRKGYLRCSLNKGGIKTNHFAHRLVCNEFLEKIENKLQVNHKNCVKTDNRIENLEWVDNYENWIHGVRNGKQNNSHKTGGIRDMDKYII